MLLTKIFVFFWALLLAGSAVAAPAPTRSKPKPDTPDTDTPGSDSLPGTNKPVTDKGDVDLTPGTSDKPGTSVDPVNANKPVTGSVPGSPIAAGNPGIVGNPGVVGDPYGNANNPYGGASPYGGGPVAAAASTGPFAGLLSGLGSVLPFAALPLLSNPGAFGGGGAYGGTPYTGDGTGMGTADPYAGGSAGAVAADPYADGSGAVAADPYADDTGAITTEPVLSVPANTSDPSLAARAGPLATLGYRTCSKAQALKYNRNNKVSEGTDPNWAVGGKQLGFGVYLSPGPAEWVGEKGRDWYCVIQGDAAALANYPKVWVPPKWPGLNDVHLQWPKTDAIEEKVMFEWGRQTFPEIQFETAFRLAKIRNADVGTQISHRNTLQLLIPNAAAENVTLERELGLRVECKPDWRQLPVTKPVDYYKAWPKTSIYGKPETGGCFGKCFGLPSVAA